jgi:hypothetical protein
VLDGYFFSYPGLEFSYGFWVMQLATTEGHKFQTMLKWKERREREREKNRAKLYL